MSIILFCDHTIPLNTVCDIYIPLIDQAIQNPESNIRLAWEAVTLGNRLLVGLCQCFQTPCTCATQKTSETLSSFKNFQVQLYCRERARKRDTDTVYKQYSIGSTSFVRQQACILHPALIEGELGIITGTRHNTWGPYGQCGLHDPGYFGDPRPYRCTKYICL